MGYRTEVIVKYCRYGCGTQIHFEDSVVSSSGKKIPLESDDTPHNCPFSPYNENKTSSPHDLEFIEDVKKLFLNTLNRRLTNYVVIDFLILEKEPANNKEKKPDNDSRAIQFPRSSFKAG